MLCADSSPGARNSQKFVLLSNKTRQIITVSSSFGIRKVGIIQSRYEPNLEGEENQSYLQQFYLVQWERQKCR